MGRPPERSTADPEASLIAAICGLYARANRNLLAVAEVCLEEKRINLIPSNGHSTFDE